MHVMARPGGKSSHGWRGLVRDHAGALMRVPSLMHLPDYLHSKHCQPVPGWCAGQKWQRPVGDSRLLHSVLSSSVT